MVRRLNVDGDGQGDRTGHGGEQRAVFVYQREAYDYWAKELHRDDFVMGQFGENFTVEGLPDDEVCIGDRYQIGEAVFEVTQPRVTCYRIGIRMKEPQMPALLVARGKPGFYFRVLKEGRVKAGDSIALITKGPEAMTVQEIDALLYLPKPDRNEVARAVRIPALSSGWQSSFAAVLQQKSDSGNAGLVADISPPAAWAGFRKVRIADLALETQDVVAMELETPDRTSLPTPVPGQFVVLRLAPPAVPDVLMRSYSICGIPSSSRYRLGIKREPQGLAGGYLVDRARVGEVIEMSAPRGSFVLKAGADPVIFVSAGIGVTPVLEMLRTLADASSQQEVWWLYAARNRSEYPFYAEVARLLSQLPNARANIWYSRPAEQDVLGRDYDSQGHIDAATFEGLGIAPNSQFYLCGPTALIDNLRAQLANWGVPAGHVHTEFFGSQPPNTPGIAASSERAPHAPAGAPGTGPSISFARSSLDVRWNSTFNSLLELAEACDVPVRWSCRTGVCHTCETGIIAGDVSYGPEPLEPPVQGSVLVCCSVPRDDVILDL
jgi:ferredoxin-NADP reductase/MOSC domain-containing protein YiiM